MAQPSLTLPNNSAGSPLDTPPNFTIPSEKATPRDRTVRETPEAASEKLDPAQRGYVTENDTSSPRSPRETELGTARTPQDNEGTAR
jgi:hypothetical protein